MYYMRAGGIEAMSSTAKDTPVKETAEDKRDSVQRKPVRAVPPVKLTALPMDELKFLRAEMRLG